MQFASRSSVLLVLILALGACTNVHQATKKYRALSFDQLLIVTPSQWTERETLEKFIDHKRTRGFDVTVLPVDLSMNAQERFDHVRDGLRRHEPATGAATAVLILGDLEMIPAGPWRLEGVDEAIYSDVPITITHENAPGLDEEVQRQDLEGHFETLPSHVVGRIPYEDPSLVDTVLASSMRYEQGASDRKTTALFAAAPWGPPFAVGIIIDGARDAMVARGWDGVVYGVDGSRDVQLGGQEYFAFGHVENGVRETFVATGLMMSLKAQLQEPLERLPEPAGGLTWSMTQPEDNPKQEFLRVTCFVPFTDGLDSTSTLTLVRQSKTDELQQVLKPTVRRLVAALQQEMGNVSTATLAFSAAGVTVERISSTTTPSCTCNKPWSQGRCDECGANFAAIRERVRLDTLTSFCKRNFDGKIPATSQFEKNGITNAWVRTSPALVYSIGHGGRFSNGWESTLQFVVSTLSIAAESLDVHAREPSFEFKIGEEIEPVSPAEPAVLFATGCAIAAPGDPLLRDLFVDRWIVAYLGATTTVGPYPILPSTNAESDFARYLGAGLPVGLAGHATLAGYLNDARLDPTLYLIPGTIEGMRTNLACYILYGDPTLELPPVAPQER